MFGSVGLCLGVDCHAWRRIKSRYHTAAAGGVVRRVAYRSASVLVIASVQTIGMLNASAGNGAGAPVALVAVRLD